MYLDTSHVCNWSMAFSNYEVLRFLGMGLVLYPTHLTEYIKICMNSIKVGNAGTALSQTPAFIAKVDEEAVSRCICHKIDPTGKIFEDYVRKSIY